MAIILRNQIPKRKIKKEKFYDYQFFKDLTALQELYNKLYSMELNNVEISED